MKHFILNDERTIFITYIDEIAEVDAQKLTDQVIEIIKNSSEEQKFNFVLDLTDAYITSIMSLRNTATTMSPYYSKMNNAYIVGAQGIQMTFAKMFVKFIGTVIRTDKIKFYNTVEEVKHDIDRCWTRYIIKQKMLNTR